MQHLECPSAVRRSCEEIIEALRAELLDYGAVLNLLHLQQEALLSRTSDLIREVEQNLATQLAMLSGQRSYRKSLILALTQSRMEPALRETMQFFPEPMRPLVAALAEEIGRLAGRVRLHEQQNQRLGARVGGQTEHQGKKPEPRTGPRRSRGSCVWLRRDDLVANGVTN